MNLYTIVNKVQKTKHAYVWVMSATNKKPCKQGVYNESYDFYRVTVHEHDSSTFKNSYMLLYISICNEPMLYRL